MNTVRIQSHDDKEWTVQSRWPATSGIDLIRKIVAKQWGTVTHWDSVVGSPSWQPIGKATERPSPELVVMATFKYAHHAMEYAKKMLKMDWLLDDQPKSGSPLEVARKAHADAVSTHSTTIEILELAKKVYNASVDEEASARKAVQEAYKRLWVAEANFEGYAVGCQRCGIAIRSEGGHLCEECGRNI